MNKRPMPDKKTFRVIGSLLGLALGDAYGARYEGGMLERLLWRLIGTRNGNLRWTDDTQMTVDIVESLLQRGGIDQSDLAARFACSYRWSRGYGPGAARVLKRIRGGEPWKSASRAVYAQGSYGNGGAMRSPAIGLFFAGQGIGAVTEAAEAAAAVTHAHPLAQDGAVLIAVATALAFQGADSRQIMTQLLQSVRSAEHADRLKVAAAWLETGRKPAPGEVASRLGKGIAAVESCTTAVYLAARFIESDFDDLLACAIGIGGDVDTIAAMACGIWGAARGFGELPEKRLNRLEDKDRLLSLAASFAEVVNTGAGPATRRS